MRRANKVLSQAMKILHIIDSINIGGAQNVIKGIFESQNENHNIFLFVLRKSDVDINIIHPNVNIFPSFIKYSFAPLIKLKKLIVNENIEVLHCHLFRSQVFGFLLKYYLFPNIKLIIHEHGEILLNHYIYDKFMMLSNNKVDLYITVSNATRNVLIKKAKINKKRTYVLYNHIDLDKINNNKIKWDIKKEKEILGINNNIYSIGFVGRLSKEKGCEYLIKSLTKIKFAYKILIAGDGTEKRKLLNLARKLNVDKNIIFLGYRNDILKIYSLIDVLVIPSLHESFGLSAIEAQAIGIPVIASNIEGLNEIINDNNCLFFKAGDESDLYLKINYLQNNKDLSKSLIQNGLINSKKYNINKYLEELNNIIDKLSDIK